MSKKYTDLFESELIAETTQSKLNIALPEALEPRTVDAIKMLADWGCLASVHTLQSKVAIDKVEFGKALQYLVPLEDESVNFTTDDSDLLKAGRLLAAGVVDSVLAGAVHTTAEVIRAAIATVGVKPGMKTVSGAFYMQRAGNVLPQMLLADCGVVIQPTVNQLLDIAVASVETWTSLNDHPPVLCFLSFASKGSATHQDASKMAEAFSLFKTRYPHIHADGELQFDAAFSAEIGQRKGANPNVAGKANIFIFPDLSAGNIAYKICERLAGYAAFGPILQGTGKVFSDLSRGASARDIAISALINQRRVKRSS